YAYLNASFQSGYTNPIDNAVKQQKPEQSEGWNKLDEIPYDFARKRVSILVEKESARLQITKGAFKEILCICTRAETEADTQVEIGTVAADLNKRFAEFSNQGFRVLGLAFRKIEGHATISREDEKQMIFLGVLLFWDPLKKNIDKTIHNLQQLGINLKIITGDNKMVAMHAGKLLGISEEKVLTGAEIQHMSEPALIRQAARKTIFAEIEPNQKERIVLALRKAGHVVGYMGDGINDVTALHAADVSISVHSAADAAKEVADIVLLKKDLSVLEEGVKAGRMTFANTLKYVFMATSANFGNMFSMAGASLLLNYLPLLPKQVLLTNLMTDFPEMTIATDNVDEDMVRKPLRWNIHFIRRFMIVFGLISSIFDFATFGVLLLLLNASRIEFRTGWFVESIVSATLIVLVVRTFKPFYTSMPSIYLLGTVLLVVTGTILIPFTPIAPYLGLKELPPIFYPVLGLIVALYVLFVEIAKRIFFKRFGLLN
ncbi:MAG: HAD-IC family P-type ATPase, partial [Parachlamydia sp.]|nr:HAD-IC family P-type ATPase [Parachlamydia sp.]